jgi:histidinol-phosphate aminotransferase
MSGETFSPLDGANPHVRELHPYVPGTQPTGSDWIKLNTNELPYPASPAVAEAVSREVGLLRKYPSPTSAELRRAIADLHGVEPTQVIVGNGSDEILTMLVRAFTGPGRPVGETTPSYSLYPVLSSIQNTTVESVPLRADLSLDLEKIHACTAPLFFLTTPNAPFGVGFPLDTLRQAIAGYRGLFVADEAYVDFGDTSAVELLAEFPHLVVTRSFSKSYGLAGLRVGYALASAETIDLLDCLRDSYNVNRLSQAGALAALRDQAYLREVVGKVRATRERFSRALEEAGWTVHPSHTNFVFAYPPEQPGASGRERAAQAFSLLEANRILVRYFPRDERLASGLRISIGTDAEMDRCRAVLEKLAT